MRLFVAVDPGEAVTQAVARAAERARGRAPAARWAATDGLHVTLAFLGEVEDARVPAIEAAVHAIAAKHAPVTLRFEGAGTFGPPRRPHVLWAGITGETARLAALQADLAAALVPLGYAPEDRPFHPHLTLARGRTPQGDVASADAAAALAGEAFGEATCGVLVIYRSDHGPHGPRFTPVSRAPLGAT